MLAEKLYASSGVVKHVAPDRTEVRCYITDKTWFGLQVHNSLFGHMVRRETKKKRDSVPATIAVAAAPSV